MARRPDDIPISAATQLCMSLAGRPGRFGSAFHNFLYRRLGLDFIYKAFTTADLAGAIGGMRALGVRGCGVSMPFKEAVIPLIDRLEPSAAAIGSVNTIVNDHGQLIGYNTDYTAVLSLLALVGPDVGKSFLLRGSGAMAKTIAAALMERGYEAGVVIARDEAKGTALAERHGYSWAPSDDGVSAPLIVNATPLGMIGPDEAALAFSSAAIAAASVVFDVVASPVETPLLKRAATLEKQRISGADVAMLQALEQFTLYTGICPERSLAEDAAAFARSLA